LLLFAAMAMFAQKQEEMKTVWESKLSHDFDVTGLDESVGIIMVAMTNHSAF
jgi:hypothetical protein